MSALHLAMEHAGVGLFARYSSRLDRWVQFGMAGGRVIKVDFLIDQPTGAEDAHPLLDQFESFLEAGEAMTFNDVAIALTGPTEYRPIYSTMRSIPVGESCTVRDIAIKTTTIDPDEAGNQLVHQAIQENPVPLIVPDHRIDDARGRLDPTIRSILRKIEGID